MVRFLLRDLLFTPTCIGCTKFGVRICNTCLTELKPVNNRRLGYLDRIIAANDYSGWLRDRLIQYKSGEHTFALGLAAILLTKCLTQVTSLKIVPIPSSNQKIKLRQIDTIGYLANQIRTLEPKFQVISALNLIRDVKDQVGLSFDARAINMNDAFLANQKITGNVLLLDDVITTGATISNAAKVLKLAGAASVSAVALCNAARLH